MLISHKDKFVFIHIQKTAGMSVMDALLPRARMLDRLVYEFGASRRVVGAINARLGWSDEGNRRFTGYHKHATALEVRTGFGERRFDSYYTFAFVRNPFDWLVSLFYYIRQSKAHRMHDLAANVPFAEFLDLHVARRPATLLDFVTDDAGQIIVDFVGRFERLPENLATICKVLGLAETRLPHKNPSVQRRDPDYRSYYDDASRSLVESYFADDLSTFGYSFAEPAANWPLRSHES